MTITVKELFCYPVKSCGGIPLSITPIGRTGILYDRQWMIVEEETGMFVAQRSDHHMGTAIKSVCLIQPQFRGGNLVLNAPDMSEISFSIDGISGVKRNVHIWHDTVWAVDQGNKVASWVTRFLSRERPGNYRVVRMLDKEIRPARHGGSDVGFADADSFLIISQKSLDDLNSRSSESVSIDRFRPNIVLSGCQPYDEDRMERIRIHGVEFVGKKLCVRCPTTLINQLTGVSGKEPLKTLAKYRKTSDGVVFGRNFNHATTGGISVGDVVEVLKWKEAED